MRLTPKEIEAIGRAAKAVYGNNVQVYLFGSRMDDTKRGGDIDLLVRTDSEKKGLLERVRMKALLKEMIGEQKIDIIGDDEVSEVAIEAQNRGIRIV